MTINRYYRRSKRSLYLRLIFEQYKWIREHGETLAGYKANYDEPDDPERGTLIWQADTNELKRLQAELPD
jgi:hypothetical protein